MSNSTPACTAAQRVLRVWKALRGHTMTGLSNQEIAHLTGESPAYVTRCLVTLVEEGLVTKYENGRYAHGIATLQIAQAHANHCDQLMSRIAETNQRIAAGAR
ncbi:helix-turn-helix domain-containing protein [Achromobacter anxifer]